MDSLIVVAIVVFILTFFLLTRLSHSQYKYKNSPTENVSLRKWKLGARTGYYRIVVMTSGLITVGILAVIKIFVK
jgi:hypothetical protein